jgi:hypothetical protein
MASDVPPVLSFIIPVRNDADRLHRCLESIRATAGAMPVEIIVADNGSTDDSTGVARAAGARVVDLPGVRVAEVRNLAAALATGSLLAFVDADHELDRGWSEAAVQVLQDPSVSAVGAQYHAPVEGTWVQRTYDRLRQHQPGSRPVDWLPSGNLVIRRAAFEKTGGFDASLETCEDVDLCQRLTRQGGRLLEVDRLRSVHRGDPATLSALFRGELWRGRDNLRVSLRVPLTRQTAPSVAAPLITLGALAALVVGLATWPFGGWWLAALGIGWVGALTIARALALARRAPVAERNFRLAAQAWIVSIVYDTARALALVARSGHAARRRA